MNQRNTTLYNVIFPIWLLWLMPQTWLAVLPLNFLIDGVVIWLAMRHFSVEDIKQNVKRAIFPVWGLGFLADFIGTALMFLPNLINPQNEGVRRWWYDNMANAVSFNPFSSIVSFLYVTLCVALTGFCIYWLNKKIGLKRAVLDDGQRKRIALALAIFTAPYLFYLPTAWFFA